METFKNNSNDITGDPDRLITITPTHLAPCPQAQVTGKWTQTIGEIKYYIMSFAEASQTGIPNIPLSHPHCTFLGPFRAFSTVY